MGASWIYFELEGKAKKKDIEMEIEERVEDASSYYGHQDGYSGSWNATFGTLDYFNDTNVFLNSRLADNFLSDKVAKRSIGAARYVKDNIYNKIKKTFLKEEEKIAKKIVKVSKDLDLLRSDKEKFYFSKLEELKNAKSKTIKCKNKECGSVISRKFIRSSVCPVCESSHQNHLLFSNTVIKSIDKRKEMIANKANEVTRLEDELKKLEKNNVESMASKVKEMIKANKIKDKDMAWLVGTWAAC
jgi:hypothetical protein